MKSFDIDKLYFKQYRFLFVYQSNQFKQSSVHISYSDTDKTITMKINVVLFKMQGLETPAEIK